jgi:hypothetical protein
MLKLSIYCTMFKVIIVIVYVRAVKIYAASVEALRTKERGDQNRMKLSLPQKNGAFVSFIPLKANVLFCRLKKNLT